MTVSEAEITEERQELRDFTDRLREWLGLDPLYRDLNELETERFGGTEVTLRFGFGPVEGPPEWFEAAYGPVGSREETRRISVDRAMRKKEGRR